MNLRRLKALIVKEFYQIVRDPSSILISVVLPTILLIIYGYGVSLDLKHLRIGIAMEDTSPDAQSLVKAFADSEYFDVRIGRDEREFKADIVRGDLKGIIVIPAYFTQYRNRPPHRAPLYIVSDGSDPNTARFVQNYVAAAIGNWQQQEAISQRDDTLPLIDLQPRYWFNEDLDSRNFLLPGSLAIIMTLTGTLLTSLVIAREWERGTMESLMSTPVSIGEILVAKLISYFVLGAISFTLSALLTVFLFGVPFRGSILALALVAAVFLWSALGLGLLISTMAKSQFVASQAALITAFLPAFMLSGFIFEISSMPAPIRLFTYVVPAKYLVSCLQTLFLAGNIWTMIVRNVIVMFVIGAIFFIATARRTVKRLD